MKFSHCYRATRCIKIVHFSVLLLSISSFLSPENVHHAPRILNFVNVSDKHKNRDHSTDIAEFEMLVMTVQGLRYTF